MRKTLVLLAILAFAFGAEQVSRLNSEDNAAHELVSEISHIEDDVRAEQSAHAALWNQQNDECAAEFSFRASEISDAHEAAQSATDASARCAAAADASTADLAQANGYVDAINGILSNLASQRAAENAAWSDLVNNQIQPAIDAVNGAYPILRQFASEASSFAQFSGHLTNMFTKMVAAKKVTKFSAIVSALIQSKDWQHGVSGSVVAQLEQLFDELNSDLHDSLDAANDAENNAANVYSQTVVEYNAVLDNLHATIERLESYLNELSNCVSNENNIAAEASAKADRNQQALDDATDMCAAFDAEYVNASSARDEELALLEQLKEFVQEQAAVFGEYGNDGVDAFEQWQSTLNIQKKIQRKNFISSKLQQVKLAKKSNVQAKCESCKKSFLQKKLGF